MSIVKGLVRRMSVKHHKDKKNIISVLKYKYGALHDEFNTQGLEAEK